MKPAAEPDHSWRIRDPIYNRGFSVRCCNADAINRHMRRLDLDSRPVRPQAKATTFLTRDDESGDYWITIWFRVRSVKKMNELRSGDAQPTGSILHECLHAALWGLDEVGVHIAHDNHEPVTYYAQWLFQQVYGRIRGVPHAAAASPPEPSASNPSA